MHRESVS
ncbi:Uncharacterized protein CTYZ_00002699, partial [Cryptosporidium tyzzeri]